MKVKNIYKMMAGALALAAASQGLVGCSDSWDDHYAMEGSNGTSSLLQLIKEDPELSDFLSVLKETHVYNNNRRTSVTFADLLNADQALTVWAPQNGTFNVDSLLEVCQTEKGDSTVGQHFVKNHIAHNLYNMNVQTDENVKMLNDKILALTPTALYNAQLVAGSDATIPATNGLLHVVKDDAWYTYNIYEGLTSMDEFQHIGDFLSSYEEQELDEARSIKSVIVDGKQVYSDSVMVKTNALFRVFDQIISEDSTYFMLVPDQETWQPVYDEALSYFNYGSVAKADSIGRYWANVSLIRDLIFNKNAQRSEQDSIFSTSCKALWSPYAVVDYPYHVFYKPYEAGGLMDPANFKDELMCSNGTIYRLNHWPFTPLDLYYRPLTTQGEDDGARIDVSKDDCTYELLIPPTGFPYAVSNKAYMSFAPTDGHAMANWTVTYEVKNTLSGAYDICVVILPKTAKQLNSNDIKPNKFKALLTYVDEQGETQSYNFEDKEFTNDATKADTVVLGRFQFPVCNYQQQDATVNLQIQCSIGRRETKYSRNMLLDCIYFKPVSDEAEEAKKRKEAHK